MWGAKEKLNFCKLSTNQAYYLCHIILSGPTYRLVVNNVIHSKQTCVEEFFQLSGIEDVEKRLKYYKLEMYKCPLTTDTQRRLDYALAPIDGDIPTLAVLQSKSSGFDVLVDAQVTDIDMEVLASLRRMDFKQINEKIRKQIKEEKKDNLPIFPIRW